MFKVKEGGGEGGKGKGGEKGTWKKYERNGREMKG